MGIPRVAGCCLAGLLLMSAAGMGRAEVLVTPPPVQAQPAQAFPPFVDKAQLPPDAPPSGGAVPDCVQRDAEGRFLGWMDSQHCMLSGRAISAAQWLDGLFGGWYGPNDVTGRVRLVMANRWEEGDTPNSSVSVLASAELPNARRRLRLIISDDEDTLRSAHAPTVTPAVQPATTASIRWMPDVFQHVKYTFDLGLHSNDVFVRARGLRQWQAGTDTVVRFSDTVRYGVNERQRNLIRLELEHALNPKTVFLQSNVVQYWEEEPEPVGLRWEQDWIILHRLGLQKTLSYGALFKGVQRPGWQLDSKSLFLQYRESVWRSWFFIDIEPHLTQYRDKSWDVIPSIILRLEAQFGK